MTEKRQTVDARYYVFGSMEVENPSDDDSNPHMETRRESVRMHQGEEECRTAKLDVARGERERERLGVHLVL